MSSQSKGLWGVLKSVGRGLDLSRRVVLNLIFFVLLFVVLGALSDGAPPEVPDKAALVLNPNGILVEQLSGDAMDRAMAKLTGNDIPETLLDDVLDAVHAAKDDDRIQALLLDMDSFAGAGFAVLQATKAAIEDFKSSGKPVIAGSDNYLQAGYYLASLADEVYMHHMGIAFLPGLARYRTYYRDGIDRLGVDINVFKVGNFKSAVEPYLYDGMSDDARTANIEWMGDLWQYFLAELAAHRGLEAETLANDIERMDQLLEEYGGQTAEVAKAMGLVDHFGGRDQIRERMIELVGEDEDSHSFHRVGFKGYLEALGEDRPKRSTTTSGDAVALVVAKGTIVPGSQAPGTIGGDSTAAQIRRARNDDEVKAIVLRVDSGGGSAFASEVIRRELVLAREEGKKVVVSMGNVAASGGYWISTASDEIWASPSTITGSIGIFGMFPTYQDPLKEHLGITVDGVGTTWLAGSFRPDRAMDDRVKIAMQTMISQGYEDFLARVGEARDMSREEVDEIAQGRVWSGQDAHDLGLVDQLGGLDDALASAVQMAELGDSYRVITMEEKLDWKDELLADFLSKVTAKIGPIGVDLPEPLAALERTVERESKVLEAVLQDPRGMVADCACSVLF